MKQRAKYIAPQLLGTPTRKSDDNVLYFGRNQGSFAVTIQGKWAGSCYDYDTNQSYDLIDVIQQRHGCSFLKAIEIAEDLIGSQKPDDDPQPPRQPVKWVKEAEEKRAEALRIWNEAGPLFSTPLVEQYYVEHRKVPIQSLRKFDHVLRWSPRECAIVALVTNIETGNPQAILRTFLSTIDGHNIGRKYLGPVDGGVIRVCADVADCLTIGEGIENVMAGMILGYRPGWACGSAGGLSNFPIIERIRHLTILVDRDKPNYRQHKGGAGQKAVVTCAERWKAAGKRVTAIMPKTFGDDMNNILIKGRDRNELREIEF